MDFNAPRWRSIDGSPYEFDERSAGGEWIRVRGGGLTNIVRAKFASVAGIPRLMGLEFDSGEPLTARQLREPRITAMEASFAAYLDQDQRALDDLNDVADDLTAAGDLPDDEAEERHSTISVIHQIRAARDGWLDRLGDTGDVKVTARGRGSSPPTEGELRAFAAEFTRQQGAGRGAVQRTAEVIGMNRSTVYRWIEVCREGGLLPPMKGN
jgi:hypothetical protein